MDSLFDARIPHIYLLYGLGFFVLGVAVALEAGRTSEFRFARAMQPLALFGLLHGTHEWIEMFELVGAVAYGFTPSLLWQWSRLLLLAVSFAALTNFGIQMLYSSPTRPSAGLWGTVAMFTLYLAGVLAVRVNLGDDMTAWLAAAEAWTRYALAVPGALLASAALLSEWREMRRTGLHPFATNFMWAGLAFGIYGLVGQTIVPHSVIFPSTVLNADVFREVLGFPIQVFRTMLAALMALFVIRGMRAFEVDRQRRLAAAKEEAQRATARRDALRRDLLRRTVEAQEEERGRLARELHDDTLQVLAGLSAGLVATEQILDSDPVGAERQLNQLSQMSISAIQELRRLIVDLRPSMLDDMGLLAAARWYADQVAQRTGLEITVSVNGLECRLPSPVETTLFRISQEALNNVARHAQASQVELRFMCDRVTSRLEVEDDGVGFDPAEVLQPAQERRGWGLVGIQERVTLAGGEFQVQSTPGGGTILKVTVPSGLVTDNSTLETPDA